MELVTKVFLATEKDMVGIFEEIVQKHLCSDKCNKYILLDGAKFLFYQLSKTRPDLKEKAEFCYKKLYKYIEAREKDKYFKGYKPENIERLLKQIASLNIEDLTNEEYPANVLYQKFVDGLSDGRLVEDGLIRNYIRNLIRENPFVAFPCNNITPRIFQRGDGGLLNKGEKEIKNGKHKFWIDITSNVSVSSYLNYYDMLVFVGLCHIFYIATVGIGGVMPTFTLPTLYLKIYGKRYTNKSELEVLKKSINKLRGTFGKCEGNQGYEEYLKQYQSNTIFPNFTKEKVNNSLISLIEAELENGDSIYSFYFPPNFFIVNECLKQYTKIDYDFFIFPNFRNSEKTINTALILGFDQKCKERYVENKKYKNAGGKIIEKNGKKLLQNTRKVDDLIFEITGKHSCELDKLERSRTRKHIETILNKQIESGAIDSWDGDLKTDEICIYSIYEDQKSTK